ncbi:D-Ala-D-Ala carboxypeptidase family metallohydrolase [Spirulina subsalsa]|uniref:D-Ala-D-Ala carboxypeptidase family metallohydrolase n=1 Tax=Spirulina subsalsa TaxID=54311 RepID=UPI0002E94506|nr:D-Ala-D-Ala carboxypeptidase family metallohydrolase [Spirulina subsalsa]
MNTPTLTKATELSDLSTDQVRWIQSRLEIGGYLPTGQVDGIAGPLTRKALAAFKEDLWLEFPSLVGPSTIQALSELAPRHSVSEQPQALKQQVLTNAGQLEGKSVVLPKVGKIYEHQYIVPDVPLTWGEMTKGLDFRRIPNSVEIVEDMERLAIVFGRVRSRFGSPIGITSGYRPAALRIGVPNSQHIFGRAMDIYPLNGDFRRLLELLKVESAVKGIGLGQKRGFLHMDIRPGDRVIFPY